jgi:hypothetical protein
MARFINPRPQYRPNSKLFFFKSGTNSQLVTYKDQFETTGLENTHPVLTDSAGVVPNIFFSGSAKIVIQDENSVQYGEYDPVGGEKELGDFTLWDSVVTYDKSDIVEGSNGKFYQSLSNGNIGNEPSISPTLWVEVELLGTWNTNITYSVGGVVKTSFGNLWKALVSQAGNDPETDSGTNWIPAINGAKEPEIIALKALNSWDIPKTANFTGVSKESRQIDASANTIDIALPVLAIGDSFVYHNLITSTFKVQILNPIETIKGKDGDIATTVNMELEPGQSVQMAAKSTTVLSIVGALV